MRYRKNEVIGNLGSFIDRAFGAEFTGFHFATVETTLDTSKRGDMEVSELF